MDTEGTSKPVQHPCVGCGACCGTYRVLFDRAETAPDSFHVPRELTEKVADGTLAMIGTNEAKPRCVALQGRIGKQVECAIYARRPGCCRDFSASYENGARNPRCDDARKGKGLRALRPADWEKYQTGRKTA